MVMDAHDEQELVFDHVNNALIRSEQMIDYFNTSVVTQILSGSRQIPGRSMSELLYPHSQFDRVEFFISSRHCRNRHGKEVRIALDHGQNSHCRGH
jgi:hypothetical protein